MHVSYVSKSPPIRLVFLQVQQTTSQITIELHQTIHNTQDSSPKVQNIAEIYSPLYYAPDPQSLLVSALEHLLQIQFPSALLYGVYDRRYDMVLRGWSFVLCSHFGHKTNHQRA